MKIATQSYGDKLQQYSDALNWMREIGVTLSSGRTQNYLNTVEYWKDNYLNASDSEAKEAFPDFVSSMFEIHDFIDIHKAFNGVSIDQLSHIVEKLQKGVKGPINSSEETPKSTVARNFLFEAVVAAKAHKPDKGVIAILDAKSDTGIKIDKRKLWVECKRITSADKIEANVKKASSQLEKTFKNQVGSGHRGIVALDVTKLINAGDQIYVANDDEQLQNSVDRMMDEFMKENSQIWEKIYKRRSKKIIGTILRFSFMATSESRNLLVYSSQWGLNPRIGISDNDESIQRLLVRYLKG